MTFSMSVKPSFSSNELNISEGTILGKHHKVEAFLGEGSFGVVTKCLDTQTNKMVAIKVNKSDPEILQQAKLEIFILEQLRRLDADRCNIVNWNGSFLDEQRVCLNFELLDQSLGEYIANQNNQGLPLTEIRPILHQVINALFHLDSLGIVHADLKPANIMVANRHESPIKVKLIDFGIACPASAAIPGGNLGTIGYCAPEIMLGLPFNQAIDMWSLGLIAVELATGVQLYPGEDDYDVLKFLMETQGQPPDHLLDAGMYTDSYFIEDKNNQQRWRFKTAEQFQYETDYQAKDTRYMKLNCLDELEQIMQERRGPENGQKEFVSLVKQMLALDANHRITPSEVLKHPFFNPVLSESSPDTDMSCTGKQNHVVSQQPSSWKSERSQKSNCSFQNSVKFSNKRDIITPANPSSSKDEMDVCEGTILGKHHKVAAFLGEGSFGIVTKCLDTQTSKTVAIKVNRSDPEILQQVKIEIFMLEQLRRLDADGCSIVNWNGYFLDGQRICLNFELLDQSLCEYIADRDYQGLPVREFRPILHQVTNALFHLDSLGIVHADLKPANIMVANRHESPVKVRLIDFGLACPTSAVIPGDSMGTIGYCAPEIMLGLPFNQAIDMWSLGLIAVELATGAQLYPAEDDYDVLRFLMETQGQLPDHLLNAGLYTECYFIKDSNNQQRWTFKTEQQYQCETNYQAKDTRYIKLKCLDDVEPIMQDRRGPENGQKEFVSLLKQMLTLDANHRITPSEVLKHPFF